MPKVPEFLEPKEQKSDRGLEIEWRTVSYRSVAVVGVLLVVATAIVLYLLYPEQIRRAFAKVFPDRVITGPVYEQR